MKTYFTLAVLIAATLALGACSNAPHSGGVTAFDPVDPTTRPYPVEIGNIELIGFGPAVGAMDAVEFKVPVMVKSQPGSEVGAKRAFAFFRADYTGTLKVTTKEGKLRVYVGSTVGGVEAPDLAVGHSPAQGVTLRRGWYRLDVQCLSDQCVDVVATFDGKPILPYALPGYPYLAPLGPEGSTGSR